MKKFIYFFIFLLILTFNLQAQDTTKTIEPGTVIGEIFTLEEANEKFGPVEKYSVLSQRTLMDFAKNYGDYLMFGFTGDECGIYTRHRSILFGFANNNKLEKYHVLSTSKILELLDKEGKDKVMLEQRGDTFTITYGATTLEMTVPCPPICP